MTGVAKTLPTPQSSVLKNGSYLVLLIQHQSQETVQKISHKNPTHLWEEAQRIDALKRAYPQLGARMPQILQRGEITTAQGPQWFYELEYVPGGTLSHAIQSQRSLPSEMPKNLVGFLLDHAAEHRFDEAYNGCSGTWLLSRVTESLTALRELTYLSPLVAASHLTLNGQTLVSFEQTLERLLQSGLIEDLNQRGSMITSLGHWNFHAENILLSDSGPMFIDPDTKFAENDPYFGLARLFYSLPHDTVENGKYSLGTKTDLTEITTGTQLEAQYLWDPGVLENYRRISPDGITSGIFNLGELDRRLLKEDARLRLDLNILHCLLRGAAINYQDEISFDSQNGTFRNSGIFLYLAALAHANQMLDYL